MAMCHRTFMRSSQNTPIVFQQAHIDGGAVTWPGHVDLAPDAMYEAIKSRGEWVLR
jgi:hypothetical protein